MIKSLWSLIEDPAKFRRLNGWLCVIWLLAAAPICIFLASSVPFLVFISVYAVVTGHLATWQAARVEERQEVEEQKRDDHLGERVEHKVDKITEKV